MYLLLLFPLYHSFPMLFSAIWQSPAYCTADLLYCNCKIPKLPK
uniref:Uncharacterized protein n=1 Tax=Siphoviridae sp. ctA995 TaxID=2826180 RepID=A0A8S5LYA5_9CAUD|nr:MAG TPA: hypothetical protein [Siphoviridae sp. ctA995]